MITAVSIAVSWSTAFYVAQAIRLGKGKPSIRVDSAEDLIKALETVKVAVEAGELDSQIEIASAKLRSGFSK